MSTEVKGLTGAEICKVIATCRKNNVSHLKFGELDVKFSGQFETEPVEYHINYPELKKDEPVEDSSPKVDMEELALIDPSAWAAADMGEI